MMFTKMRKSGFRTRLSLHDGFSLPQMLYPDISQLSSPGTAISMVVHFRIAFSTMIISGLLCATVMSVQLGATTNRCITVSSFVPHNLHLGETGCLSIFALIALVGS